MKGVLPRVLVLSHSPYFGGAEHCLYYLVAGLARKGFHLSVLLPNKPVIHPRNQQDLSSLISALDIPTRHVPLRWNAGNWPLYHAFAYRLPERVARIAQIIQEERIDLVVTNTGVILEGALASRQCGVPHIWHILEMFSRDPVLRPFRPLDQLYALMDDLSFRIVGVSQSVKDEVSPPAAPGKVQVIHTGLPENLPKPMSQPKREMLGLSSDTPVITFVGVLSERKGVVDLVDAAPTVLGNVPAAVFVLAGPDGGKGSEVADKLRRHGMEHAFRILGNRNDIPNILAASDMLVLPSLADPLPLSVLEAMQAGVPVIATRSGGCEEMVQDGQTGYLVPIRSSELLAERIVTLLRNPRRRTEMGKRAKERVTRHFGYEKHVDEFGQLLQEAFSCPQTPRDRTLLGTVSETIRHLQHQALSRAKSLRTETSGFRNRIKKRVEATIRLMSLM